MNFYIKIILNIFLNFIKKNKIRENEISHTDMMEALIKVIEEIFIDTQIKLCYFHLS